MASPTILLVGTLDTKLDEYSHLHHLLSSRIPKATILLLDVGQSETFSPIITHTHHSILSYAHPPIDAGDLKSLPRGEVITSMIAATTPLVRQLYQDHKIHGAIALGGSGGTALASRIMRDALPLGFPKLIVSTVASGDTSSYVGETDITLMYSVVDIAGLNTMLRSVLANAAAAIHAMSISYQQSMISPLSSPSLGKTKKSIAISMFGVTTPAVTHARSYLESLSRDPNHNVEYEINVFHATGSGGRAMERMIAENRINAVLDLTTTELADELVGGNMSAGPNRLSAAAKAGIPQIVSVGACDMVNFGAMEVVPKEWKMAERKLFIHNPSVTLMRTSKDECVEIGRRIAERLKSNCTRKERVEVWLPLGGVSMLSTDGQTFEDKEADEALFGAIKDEMKGSAINVVEREGQDINDQEFAVGSAKRLVEMLEE
ncbi:hypothetical protein K469DRAFT_63947 [Zopfia rhizophila CBS 207.26]|uniref:Uncharacterized protein n=1 Tax=Zopfia rhizophila CBS 207.26 TaxID=1314779 RepID=A0A6A6EGV6_9PEZI|nr:hypothetical protein K469DRAFT_63947 [Zopfia rhizophila CBS 207.26]